jgi:hypothetical protein
VKLQCIKVISLAGVTCDSEKEILIHTDNVFEKIFEKVKYFKKVFKYKYFSFLKVKYKYFEKHLNTFKYKCI